MGTVSRAEYLKKYTTDSSENPKTKKSTNLLECQVSRNFSIIRTRPGCRNSQASDRF
ncbi:unnamed protein product [Meloidogyne enterolobii]|uniref:Uncharacterized protein n=1 Tax=Meloidogyne enterolobii TaxID=390850 RepID=A0ACB1A897_MELEN